MSEPTGARRYGTGGGDAYYDAVKYGGYEGTREQFGKDQAEFATNATAVAAAKEVVEQDTEEVRSTKETFVNTTVPDAITAIQQEGTTQVQAVTQQGEESSQQVEAVGTQWKDEVANEGRARVQAVEQAGTNQVQAVNDAGTTQVGAVNQAGADQVNAVEQAGTGQVQAVTDEGTTQITAVEDAGAAERTAIEEKGEQTRESIPDDYTALSDEVDNLNRHLSGKWVETYTRPEVHASFIFTNSKLYKKASITVGVTKLSEIQTDGATGCYNYKIPVDGGTIRQISFPCFAATSNYCDFVIDENDVVIYVFDNEGSNPGTQVIREIPAAAKYFILTIPLSINNANPNWYYSAKAYGFPDVREDIDNIVNAKSDAKRVIHIDNSAKGLATVYFDRTEFTAGDTIIIVSCGENVFDGVTQNGYWNGNTVTPSSTYKCTVNPIYVNGGDALVFSRPCRVTEFTTAGAWHTSYIASAGVPYLVSLNTNYVHISSENANMAAMYVAFSKATSSAYKGSTASITVPSSGDNLVGVAIPTYDDVTNIHVSMVNSPDISVIYSASVNQLSVDVQENATKINAISSSIGTKIAQSNMFVAHRGSTIEAPENTMPAIVQAFLNGYKSIEIDVRFASGDVPVLLHDSTIDRTSNGTGAVSSLTYAQLQTYDFGSWFSSKFVDTRIPTLQDALSLISKLGAAPHLDIAGSSMTTDQINIICDLLFRYGLEEKAVWLLNPSAGGLAAIKAKYTAKQKKFMSMWQVSTFPEETVISLLDNINNNLRNDDSISDMGISINQSALTTSIKETALSYTKPIPIGVYFIDDYNNIAAIHDYPFLYITTNRLDLPMAFAHYYAPSMVT